MPSVAKVVAEAISQDVVVTEALARGIVNARALARWLKDTYALDATEESVVTAIRRHASRQGSTLFEPARRILKRSHVNSRASMCSLALMNTRDVQARLPDLFRIVDATRGQTIRVISSEKGFKVILDEDNLPKLTQVVGQAAIEEVKRGLTELTMVIPRDSRSTPGILALIAHSLALRGINIAEVVDGIGEHHLLVASADALQAYQVLSDLVQGTPPSSPSPPPEAARRRPTADRGGKARA